MANNIPGLNRAQLDEILAPEAYLTFDIRENLGQLEGRVLQDGNKAGVWVPLFQLLNDYQRAHYLVKNYDEALHRWKNYKVKP